MVSIFDHLTASGDVTSETKVESGAEAQSSESTLAPEVNRTPERLREAAKELLKFGLLEAEQKPNLYRTATINLPQLNEILESLDLFAQVDEIRGLVFLSVLNSDEVDAQEDWSHPLVRKQRLTLEQSLLVAILRQYFVAHEQEAGTGAALSVVTVDELVSQLQLYLGDTGSEQKERNRMFTLLDQLKSHGLVTAVDAHERVIIRPLIAHLANPNNLYALLQAMKAQLSQEQC